MLFKIQIFSLIKLHLNMSSVKWWPYCPGGDELTHWGRVMHICVSKLTIIGSDNGLSPGRRQAIIWTNAGILLIRPLGTNFNEMLIEILTFSFMKMRLKVSSGKWRPFCLGLNVLKRHWLGTVPGSMECQNEGQRFSQTNPAWISCQSKCQWLARFGHIFYEIPNFLIPDVLW